MIAGTTVTMPLSWFVQPLRQSLSCLVRPPTAKTRRVQRIIEKQMPAEAFFHLLSSFGDEELQGLKWEGDALRPTSTKSKSFLEYKYAISKPSQLDTFWGMDMWEPPGKGMWRRGHGAAKLHLSRASEQRGATTSLLAMVCGNVAIRMRQPRQNLAMPVVRIVFSVLSMDAHGHIIWPTDYGPKTAAALRKMARSHLQAMILDALYPTTDGMALALTAPASSSRWQAPPPVSSLTMAPAPAQ